MRILSFAAALLALSWGSAVPAAERDTSLSASAEDVRRMSAFASCIAERRTDEARALLAMDFTSEAYGRDLRKLAQRHHGCISPLKQARFNGLLFAGGLAETLFESDLGNFDLASRTTLGAGDAPIQARDAIEAMGLCTVQADPAGTAAALATQPATPEETQALRALAPHLSRCLSSGVNTRLNHPAIRALLALAAYRLNAHRN